jgi:ferrous iron transport protein A
VPSGILPLDLLDSGTSAVVEDIQGEPHWVGRMAEIGIRQGCQLQVVRSGSPCLLQLQGCRLCLRGDDTTRILVRPVD